jgi:beta-lactamase superfamily II metal-dependent hydrolase
MRSQFEENGQFFNAISRWAIWYRVMRLAGVNVGNTFQASFDAFMSFDSGLEITFLEPNNSASKIDDLNNTSLVAHVTYGDFSALFTGDSPSVADETYPQNIDLLKVSHHGSNTASDEKSLSHLYPQYAVISVGENNTYNLPSDMVVNRLKKIGATVLRTDKLGNIQFKVKKDGSFTYKTLKGE